MPGQDPSGADALRSRLEALDKEVLRLRDALIGKEAEFAPALGHALLAAHVGRWHPATGYGSSGTASAPA